MTLAQLIATYLSKEENLNLDEHTTARIHGERLSREIEKMFVIHLKSLGTERQV